MSHEKTSPGNYVRVEPYGVIQRGLRKHHQRGDGNPRETDDHTDSPWLLGPSPACHSNPSNREPAPILSIEWVRNYTLLRQIGPTTRRPKGTREYTR